MAVAQDLLIRRANYSDASDSAAIVDLMQVYARDPMGGGESLSADVIRNLVPNLAQIPGAFTLLAFAGGEAVGLVTCFVGFSTFKCKPLINIHDLSVLKTHRGTGIGRRLLAAVEEKARSLGCARVTLEVQEGNRRARSVYESAGFSQAGLGGRTGGALFYSKDLD
mgnify:CR=1 FL=1